MAVNLFLKSILALYKTDSENSIYSNNFFVNVNLAIIQTGSVTHIYSQSVCGKEALALTNDSSFKNFLVGERPNLTLLLRSLTVMHIVLLLCYYYF